MDSILNILSRLFRTRGDRAGRSGAPRSGNHAGDPIERFEQLLGIKFNNPGILRQALTHRSVSSNDAGPIVESNERLEFLGDSVLGLVVNERLFREYPGQREGALTQMKSLLVSRPVLSRKARDMNIGRYLLMSPGEEESGGRERSSILADAFEAVIGAIYLDKGMDVTRSFIRDRLMSDSHAILRDKNHVNYKSMLQEYIQSEKKTHPQYKVTSEDGPDHEKVFTVDAMVGRTVLGRGRGKNKKQAQQEAARSALQSLGAISQNTRVESALNGPRTGRKRRPWPRKRGGRPKSPPPASG